MLGIPAQISFNLKANDVSLKCTDPTRITDNQMEQRRLITSPSAFSKFQKMIVHSGVRVLKMYSIRK